MNGIVIFNGISAFIFLGLTAFCVYSVFDETWAKTSRRAFIGLGLLMAIMFICALMEAIKPFYYVK